MLAEVGRRRDDKPVRINTGVNLESVLWYSQLYGWYNSILSISSSTGTDTYCTGNYR